MNYIRKIYFDFSLLFLLSICMVGAASAAPVVLKGKVYDSSTRKPAEFGRVIALEAKKKAMTAADGSYALELPDAGTYTIIVKSEGLKSIKLTYDIRKNSVRDFYLKPIQLRGGTLRIYGERNIQKVSRYTMTSQDIKDVPAAFGDSVSALTALPGVNRTGGFIGPLVIRSADPSLNRYYFDDIPLLNPQHLLGIHSVINSNLIREIDLYSSAFPSQFGGANAAVININSVDTVKEFSGYADLGLISANGIFKMPFFRDVPGTDKKETSGYLIVSGRYGYYSLVIPLFYKIITGDTLNSVPEYYDYQVKGRYYFNSRVWLTVMAIGNRDYWKILNVDSNDDSFDPLTKNFDFETDTLVNAQALYLNYQPGERLAMKFMVYSTLNENYLYLSLDETDNDVASWAKNFYVSSRPYIFGLKEKARFEWLKDHSELRAGAELNYYYFYQKGIQLIPNDYNILVGGMPDFGNESEFFTAPIDAGVKGNLTFSGYLENEFNIWGLKFVPGMHYEYLRRTGESLVDFRGLISYEFKSETTISVAGGQYSSFLQTNPTIFNSSPDFATLGDEIKPLRSLHSVVGLEQRYDLITAKLEGFYNYYYDVTFANAALPTNYQSDGEIYAYGIEFMLRIDRRENKPGLFGWINYTWARSKIKSNLPSTISDYEDDWITSAYEQEHTAKVVVGYSFYDGPRTIHTISARFQLNTSLPYTPVNGHTVDNLDGGGIRYVPDYTGSVPNSANLPMEHRLDIRYTHRTNYRWGYVSWYIEVINVYMFKVSSEEWDYTEAYGEGTNPQIKKQDGLSIIPNFGVEIKF